jgi:hypothetical protein
MTEHFRVLRNNLDGGLRGPYMTLLVASLDVACRAIIAMPPTGPLVFGRFLLLCHKSLLSASMAMSPETLSRITGSPPAFGSAPGTSPSGYGPTRRDRTRTAFVSSQTLEAAGTSLLRQTSTISPLRTLGGPEERSRFDRDWEVLCKKPCTQPPPVSQKPAADRRPAIGRFQEFQTSPTGGIRAVSKTQEVRE